MTEWSSSEDDLIVASFFQEFYGLTATHLEPAGTIVKFTGDGGLVVFEEAKVEAGVVALSELAVATRRRAGEFGLDTYLNISVHVGPVVLGTFGPKGRGRLDVIGKTVNIAARLGRRGLSLSSQAFRCLSGATRERFEKIKPPITYRLQR